MTLTLKTEGLFADARCRVRIEVLSGKDQVGAAVMAACGFGEGTREITVTAGQPNSATVQLLSVPASKRVSLRAVDCDTDVALAKLADVAIDLMV